MYRNFDINFSSVYQVVVLSSLQRDVMIQAQNARTAGHLGQTKTLKKIQRSFHWLGYHSEVQRWVRQCEDCARTKSPSQARAALKTSSVGAPLERIAIDIFGPLPRST